MIFYVHMLMRIFITAALFAGSFIASYQAESADNDVNFEQVTRIAHQR